VPPAPDETAEIRGQLDRILASDTFAQAERARRFLRYVVERALAGEADSLKEYAIGVDVFDRGEGYDPRIDSIVRVEAGRLRSKIDEYYNGAGRPDAVVIRLRRGSYVPLFEHRPSAGPAEPDPSAPTAARSLDRAPWRLAVGLALGVLALAATVAFRGSLWPAVTTSAPLRVVVLPFAHYSSEAADQLLADRVGDGVTTELARLGTLHVVSRTSALQFAGARMPLREIARSLNADLVMEGSVVAESDGIRVNARLVQAGSDRKFWVEEFVGTRSDLQDLERRIATAASAAALKAPGGNPQR
jgi:TolB-like protein